MYYGSLVGLEVSAISYNASGKDQMSFPVLTTVARVIRPGKRR